MLKKRCFGFLRSKNIFIALIITILFLALFLRVYNLSKESLWLDEGISVKVAHLTTQEIIKERASHKGTLFYFFLLHHWINIFGDSEFFLRSLSVIFGVLSILLIYKLGSLIFNRQVGFLSLLILSLSEFHIFYSQEARMYALAVFLTLSSFYFFIKLIKSIKVYIYAGYILFTVLLLYTHAYGFFILVTQNIYVIVMFFYSRKSFKFTLKNWILLQVIILALFLPWMGVSIKQLGEIQNGHWIERYYGRPDLNTVYRSFLDYSGTNLLFILFSFLSLISVFYYSKRYKKFVFSFNDKIFLLSLWLFCTILIPFLMSQFFSPIYLSRYTILALPAFYLLIAKGISNISFKHLKLIIIILIIVLSLVNLLNYYHILKKEQWREASAYIDKNANSEDLLLFNGGFGEDLFNYYSKRKGLTKLPLPERDNPISDGDMLQLNKTLENDYKRIWFILSHQSVNSGIIKETVKKHYNLSYCEGFIGINICLYEKQS